jgi:hypothetical protein
VTQDSDVTESVGDIVNRFRWRLNELTVGAGLAEVGLDRVVEWLSRLPRYPNNPDPTLTFGVGNPNIDMRPYGAMAHSEIALQVSRHPLGPARIVQGQNWLVRVYSLWDEDIRPRVVQARGIAQEDLQFPLFGDMRRMRHDVVHNGGIATETWTARCELLTSWFSPGQIIALRAEHYYEIIERIPWKEIQGAGAE